MRVAILGGTGAFGRPLARRLVEAGDDVIVGSRDAARARETAEAFGARGMLNDEAASDADLVVLAVQASAALETVRSLSAVSVPVFSVASRIAFGGGGARPSPDATSLAEHVAAHLDVPVLAGLHSIAAAKIEADHPPDEDAFVCGDDPAAKLLGLELAGKIVGGRAVDAGPLEVARALEGMTAVIVNLNRRYKGHAGIRITGLP